MLSLFFFFFSLYLSIAEEIGNLERWLKENGAYINLERIEIRQSLVGHGNGIFLRQDILSLSKEEDPLLLDIPYRLVFHPFSEKLSPDISRIVALLERDYKEKELESKFEQLLHYALALELRNTSSFFSPYFSSFLPFFTPLGIALSDSDLLIHSPIIIEKIRKLQTFYGGVLKKLNSLTGLSVTREEYFRACTITSSRSLGNPGLVLSSSLPLSYRAQILPLLVPYLDLLNHVYKSASQNRYVYQRKGENSEFSIQWRAPLEQREPGSELTIAYHEPPRDDERDFIFYGFTVSQEDEKEICIY